MQAVLGILRSRTALDIVYVRSLIHDDERALKLPHLHAVDAEIGLQRLFQLHALWHIDEGTTAPHRRIERCVFVVAVRDKRTEVLAHQIRMFAQSGIRIQEDHAFFLHLRQHVVVDDLRLILSRHAGEVFLFGLRDAQTIKGVLDRLRHFLPAAFLFFARFYVIGIFVKIDPAQIRSPVRIFLFDERIVRPQAQFPHPLRFVFDR